MSGEPRTFAGRPETVPEVRRFVRDAIGALGADGAIDDAVSLVSELATNAVLHARSDYTVSVELLGQRVRVCVRDGSVVLPAQRSYGVESTTGRGLRLVATLSSEWGVDPQPGGKVVWFDLPLSGSDSVPSWDAELDAAALLAAFDDSEPPDSEADEEAEGRPGATTSRAA